MTLQQQLKSAGLGAFPCVLTYDETKRRWNKQPRTVAHESWQLTAARDIDDPQVGWAGITVCGLPIPAGVIVLDGDHYKDGAMSTDGVDRLAGVAIPWPAALVQTTVSGGKHYAFRVPQEWPVLTQRSDAFGSGSAFDTRIAGKGFICTGEGYTPAGAFGVLRMAYPESLPILPDSLRPILAPDIAAPAERPATSGTANVGTVVAALAFIDPSLRAEWFDVGCALKNIYIDEPETGFGIWDAWSAGEFWRDGCPVGYAAETQRFQWGTMRAAREGATITGGTLYHKAMRGGWSPPAQFDSAGAFGVGAVAADTFAALVDRVIAEGADSRKTEAVLAAIVASGCNEMQALLLRNELKAVMRSAKILDKPLSDIIDRQTSPATAPAATGMYATSDADNADIFLSQYYPANTLIRCDGEFYFYTGKCWQLQPADMVRHQIAVAMSPARVQVARIKACFDMVSVTCPLYTGGMQQLPTNSIIFNNGVLDTLTGVLSAHSPEYLTTNILPYDFDPAARCDEWVGFLHAALDGDPERIAVLQEWLGYMLVNDYSHHKILLLLGPRRCGKGTIGRIMSDMVGDANFTGGSLSAFATDSFIASLRDKPVMFVGDAEKRIAPARVNQVIERIKSISGNDAVGFDRKFLSAISERLPTRICIAGNGVPQMFDDSGALASRLVVIPFNQSFYGREDLGLYGRLRNELAGIAAWALAGLHRLRVQGCFTLSAAGEAEAQYISEAYSPLARFITDFCTLSPDVTCTSAGIHTAYRAWCLSEGEDILKRKTFIGAVKDVTRGRGVSYGPHRLADGTIGRGFKGIAPSGAVVGLGSAFVPTVV